MTFGTITFSVLFIHVECIRIQRFILYFPATWQKGNVTLPSAQTFGNILHNCNTIILFQQKFSVFLLISSKKINFWCLLTQLWENLWKVQEIKLRGRIPPLARPNGDWHSAVLDNRPSVLVLPNHQTTCRGGDGVSSQNVGKPSHFYAVACRRKFN
jgi:hypothetical protein